jgi:CRP-like cAMP-binding protein
MLVSREPIANQLLANLSRADYKRLLPHLERVQLEPGHVLCEPGDRIRHVYFPTDAYVSLLTQVDGDSVLEVAMVGRESMVGISLTLDSDFSSFRAVVQGAGGALRLSTARFLTAVQESRTLRSGLRAATLHLISQIARTAACNRFHVVETRLAYRLLTARDRVSSDHFHLTHEFLGHLLGVRRVGITNAARALKERGLIDYSRGYISIVDGAGLEASACSCYAAAARND